MVTKFKSKKFTINDLLLRTNQLFSIFILFVISETFNFYSILSFGLLFTFSFIKRIDIIYTLFIFHINYTFSYILLTYNPDAYMFTSMVSMGGNLDIVFSYLCVILLFIIFILYIIPVRGLDYQSDIKSIFELIKISIFINSIASIFGIYGVGKAVTNYIFGYFIRITIVFQVISPFMFNSQFKKYRHLLIFLMIIGGLAAGSRAFIFSILMSLLSFALVKRYNLNIKTVVLSTFAIIISILSYPIISAKRLGQEYSIDQTMNQSTIESILTVRQRFGGVDIANGLYNSNFMFPWYQLFGELSITINKYLPGDPIPVPTKFFPSEYISAKLLSGYDFFTNQADDLRYTESMRLGRFFIIDPISIIMIFIVFSFSLFIQNKNKELNYYIRFYIIYNMLLAGAYSETFYILFDMVLLNMIIIFFYTFEIKLSSKYLLIITRIKNNYLEIPSK